MWWIFFQANIPYTSESDLNTYVLEDSTLKNYDYDCIVNNPTKVTLVCNEMCDGYSDSEIATNVGLTTSQVTKMKTKCPASCPLPPTVITQIYTMKGYGMALSMIQGILATYDTTQVEEAYNGCV